MLKRKVNFIIYQKENGEQEIEIEIKKKKRKTNNNVLHFLSLLSLFFPFANS